MQMPTQMHLQCIRFTMRIRMLQNPILLSMHTFLQCIRFKMRIVINAYVLAMRMFFYESLSQRMNGSYCIC